MVTAFDFSDEEDTLVELYSDGVPEPIGGESAKLMPPPPRRSFAVQLVLEDITAPMRRVR